MMIVMLGKKILLVEDEKFIRDLYVHILASFGYTIDESDNGEDAYARIIQTEYDIILLDIMIPKLDGLQILEKLQKENKTEKFKQIILLTNLEEEATIERGVSYGIRGYLVKSQNPPEKLAKQIEELMGA